MTVSTLIQQLQTMPPDALVITEGYEEGFDTVKEVSIITVEENAQKDWYVGKYMDSNKPDAQTSCLVICRNKGRK